MKSELDDQIEKITRMEKKSREFDNWYLGNLLVSLINVAHTTFTCVYIYILFIANLLT